MHLNKGGERWLGHYCRHPTPFQSAKKGVVVVVQRDAF